MQIEIPRAEQVHGFAKECGAAGSVRAAIPGVTIEAIVSENAVVAGRALAPLEIAVKQFRLTPKRAHLERVGVIEQQSVAIRFGERLA